MQGHFPAKKREGHNTYLIKHKETASSQERKRGYFAQLLSENLNYSLVNFPFIDVKMKQDPGYQG